MESDVEMLDETTCYKCYAEFLDPEDLAAHMSQVHVESDSGLILCQFCSALQSDSETYALHLRDHHLSALRACKLCLRVFENLSAWKRHEKKHYECAKDSVFDCSDCQEKCIDFEDLEHHNSMAHGVERTGVDITPYISILSSVLCAQAPYVLKKLGTNAQFPCIICNFRGPIREYLNHLRVEGCRAYACDNCMNSYKNVKSLANHFYKNVCKVRNFEAEALVKCSKCLKLVIRVHYKVHNLNCKPFKCDNCNIIFETLEELTKHQGEKHPLAICVVTCKFCRREFVGKVSLEKHMARVHNDLHLYKYNCVYCEETSFKHPQRLFGHFFTQHSKLKPFNCVICDMQFRTRKSFSIHIKMIHKSVGFVEFDDKYSVFFRAEKSENSFQPISVISQATIQNDEVSHTDMETDVELSERDKTRTPKMRFKEINKALNSEYDTATEIEEVRDDPPPQRKKKEVSRRKKRAETDSEDEPLNVVKGREKRRAGRTKKSIKNKLTCKQCNKYCYTFQNYERHMTIHNKGGVIKCVKCTQEFKSTEKLDEHISNEHSSSKLTETLKKFIEKRKKGPTELTMSEKFQSTIKGIKSPTTKGGATLTECDEKINVKNFIESFMPEEQKRIQIDTSVSMKVVDKPVRKTPQIKMTKFKPTPINKNVKLAMPVKYKLPVNLERCKVNVMILDYDTENVEENDDYAINDERYDDFEEDKSSVPEVAQEVLLENAEPPESQDQFKIVLPKTLEQHAGAIRIAHLAPQAPYYKIVKLNDFAQKNTSNTITEAISLPDGKKLVNVNPLAHLMGNKTVEQLSSRNKKKYYTPKVQNVQEMIAKALMKFEGNKKKNVKTANEQ